MVPPFIVQAAIFLSVGKSKRDIPGKKARPSLDPAAAYRDGLEARASDERSEGWEVKRNTAGRIRQYIQKENH